MAEATQADASAAAAFASAVEEDGRLGGNGQADHIMTDDAPPSLPAPADQPSRPEGVNSSQAPAKKESTDATMRTTSRFIQAGDLVVIYLSRDRPPVPLTVTPGAELINTYGTFPHDEMIGLPFGAKLASRNRRGFIHLLRPNPELWTLALPHRTQILYTPDMSFIASHLGLSPGARLIEAGTGSGSFSHYATRCVARKHAQSHGVGWRGPEMVGRTQSVRGRGDVNGASRRGTDGAGDDTDAVATHNDVDTYASEEEQESKEPVDDHEADILRHLAAEPDTDIGPREGRVWSFEFHAGRAVKAWNEFEHHGLFPTLSLRHRNVVKAGFGLHSMADAVFLDLPAPWDALQHAAKAMRRNVATRICCFSPCVEQVLKTVAALRKGQAADPDAGQPDAVRWTDIETYECLNRTHLSVWSGPGTLTPNASIDEAIERIRGVEQKKSRRRMMQIERARKERLQRIRDEEAAAADGDETQGSTKFDTALGGENGEQETDTNEQQAVPAEDDDEGAEDAAAVEAGQKRKRDNDSEVEDSTTTRAPPTSYRPLPASLAAAVQRDGKVFRPASVLSRPFTEMRGHTSYLTFATLVPRVVERQADPTLEREKEQAQRKEQAMARAAQRKLANAEAAVTSTAGEDAVAQA